MKFTVAYSKRTNEKKILPNIKYITTVNKNKSNRIENEANVGKRDKNVSHFTIICAMNPIDSISIANNAFDQTINNSNDDKLLFHYLFIFSNETLHN